jgi:hypothetical protein
MQLIRALTNTGNISTNTGNISTNTTKLGGVIDALSPVSGNIATNTGNISTNTGNISTNTGNISTNTTKLGGVIDALSPVSGNIATNTTNIATAINSLSPVSGNIATNTGNISTNAAAIEDNTQNIAQVAGVSGTIEDNTQNIAQLAGVSGNIATNTGNISTNTTNIATAINSLSPVSGNITTNTNAIGVIDDDVDYLGTLSGSLILTRGGGNLSAVEVSAAGEATANLSVPTFKRGPNKIAWQVPAFTVDPTAKSIEIADYYGDNLDLNLMTGGTSKLTASGIEAKSIETNTFSSDNVTASAYALQVGTSLGCPIPNPFGYIQLTSDDAASSDEKHVGYSNTPTTVLSNTDHISWDDSAKNFVVKFAGTYEVVARVFFEGGSTLIEMHVNKEGSPVNTANPRAHTTVDPVERTISAIFTCAIDDVVDVTYEATSAQTTAAQIGTTVTIKRLK